MIFNLNDMDSIRKKIKEEKLDIIVVSYGGSCSNTLVKILEKNGYCCNTLFWRDILCHCPIFLKVNIPVIYIYDDIKKAFLSVKNRGTGWWDVNQKKLSNNNDIKLSDENLLQLMIKQFYTWVKNKGQNVLIIKSQELFHKEIVTKIQSFLNISNLILFPVKYKKPKTCMLEHSLFEKYKDDIEYINNYK